MSFKALPITFNNAGLVKNKKPFLLMDNAFQQLLNAYTWRESVKKREGIKLVGRLRREFLAQALGNTVGGTTTYTFNDILATADITGVSGVISGATNAAVCEITTLTAHNLQTGQSVFISVVGGMTEINNLAFTIISTGAMTFTIGVDSLLFGVYTSGGVWTNEPNKQLEKGSVVVTIAAPDAATFTDDGDGTFTVTGVGVSAGSFVNYATGEVVIVISASVGGAAITADFNYYPSLPVMGIPQREVAAINLEQTLFFDTKYVYTYDGNDFASSSSTIWGGNDANFFWGENYRGSEADDRLFFVTNNTLPSLNSNNVIRHTSDAGTWTDFTPAIAGTRVSGETVGTLAASTTPFNGSLLNTPIIPGTVTITISDTTQPGADADVRFKDQIGTYPAGTLIGAPPANTGIIDYVTGAIELSLSPVFDDASTITATYQYEETYLFQARLIVSYYGRLLAFDTFEGEAAGTATNFFNRCRFSQVGDPLQQNAWIATTFGKGGFIDAPTNESIVSARFYKNTLIVFFERTTWQLRYVGEYGLPFLWERISSDFGSESTFSTLLFDSGVLAVGDKAIVSSSGNDVKRIDLDIPDTVFNFHNQDSGKERVHSIRDFQKEIVFWNYSDGGLARKFPNRTLIFNYRNQTWAILRDNVTAFGTLASPTGDLWDLNISWDSDTSWDSFLQPELPIVVSGNQQGFIHFYQSVADVESIQDNATGFREHESLYVKSITRSATAPLRLEIPDHNLESQEIIYMSGLAFVNTVTSVAVATSLNDKFYIVQEVVDDDNIDIYEYDVALDDYLETSHDIIAYTPAPGTGTYVGCGVVTLLPKLDIITKDFNPIDGQKIKSSYTDFQTDATPNAEVSVLVYVDSNINPAEAANLPVYNPNMETAISLTGVITNIEIDTPSAGNTQITSASHGLLNNRSVTFGNVNGMTEINGLFGTVTFVDQNTFSVNITSTAFTAYTHGGQWWTQDENAFYIAGSNYSWHRFYSNVHGQYIAYQITYNDALMNNPTTHSTDFQMNAMMLNVRPAGRLIT